MRVAPTVLAPALAWLLLAGCTSDVSASSRQTDPLPAPSASASSPASPGTGSASPSPGSRASALAARGTPGAPQDVVTGLAVPWTIAVLPDGTALVTERDTARVVRVWADGSTAPVRGTGPDGAVAGVDPRGEGGLLGLTISPTFAGDGLVYAFTTTADDDRVVRMRWTRTSDPTGTASTDRSGGTLSAPEPLLTGIPAATIHHGGRLAFGPDGMLYVSTGEAGDPPAAQDRDELGGKILRITADGAPAPGNPVAGSPVWSWGHRNVQGLGWDAAGRLFASEFGQNRQDEVNLVRPGRNYGWPLVEGTVAGPQGSAGDVDDPRFTAPVLTWSTSDASPSGLLVTGDAIYVAALRGERLWRIPLDDGVLGTPKALVTGLGRLRDVTVGPDGDLWVLTNNTSRGTPRAGDDRLVRLPLT